MRLAPLLAPLVLLVGASPGLAQVPLSAGFRDGFFGPFDGYGAIWAYPTDYANGPSPYYSPIMNSMAASRPGPNLEPSPYYRSPLDLLRFNRPEPRKHAEPHARPLHRIFRRR